MRIASLKPFSILAAFLAFLVETSFAVAADKLPLDAPIPEEIPPKTVLVVGGNLRRAFELSGELKKTPFRIEFTNLGGGPQTIDAFHARALDVGSAGDIPAINARWIGIPVKIVSVVTRKSSISHGIQFGIAPGSGIDAFADFRGKKIAFAPSQAQGAQVLRTLKRYGLEQKDVELIEIPATIDSYSNALGARLVDAAPISRGLGVRRYLANYARDGAKVLTTDGVKEDPSNFFVRVETLQDPAKAAAIKYFLRAWARATVWAEEHRDEYIRGFYIKDHGLSEEEARIYVREIGDVQFHPNWDEQIASYQETIDFMAEQTGHERYDARDLFDARFESVAAVAAEKVKTRR